MKKYFKKVPALIIVSLIIVLTVAFAVIAANVDSVETWLNYYVNGEDSALTDLDKNGTINILDAILFHKQGTVAVPDGYTKGIY